MVVQKVTTMKGTKAGSGIGPAGFTRSSSKQTGRNKPVHAAKVQIEQTIRFGNISLKGCWFIIFTMKEVYFIYFGNFPKLIRCFIHLQLQKEKKERKRKFIFRSMVKPRHHLNLYFYVYLNVSCQTELCLLRSKGKKKKYWSTNKNSCCATLNVEQKEATAELYILDANASCLPP